jgi:hypothetical protein
MKRKITALILAVLICAMCAACGSTSGTSTQSSASASAVQTSATVSSEDMFTDRDYEVGYSDYVTVTLADGASSADGSGVTIDGDTITITTEGTYLFTGTLKAGQIVVDVSDSEKVQIVLSDASVTNSGAPAIYVKSADKVFITTASGSDNTVASTGAFVSADENNADGAIFSQSDLTLNGGGTLTVSSESGHGIVSKDDLRVTSGTYNITASSQGLSGKDSVRIAGGTFTINSGKDAVHSENTDDASKGFVYISGGTFAITSGGDGVDASGTVTILDGSFGITAGGGSANAAAHTSDNFGGRPDQTSGATVKTSSATTTAAAASTATDSESDSESDSTKGVKAGSDIVISGGSFTIDSADDAIHSNANVSVSGGSFNISTGDDGIHADGTLAVSDGTVEIAESYEGIEGEVINVSGGSISVVSSDDGFNAAGGNDSSGASGGDSFASDSSASLTISGGTITVDADGDGLDSNGALTVSGGTVYVSGPTGSGNGALDYGSDAAITGGTVIAVGSTGMDVNFGDSSTQGSILVDLSSVQAAGTAVTLKDSSGNVLATYTPDKQFQSVVVSAAGVESGKTYTLTVGSATQTIEMTSVIYGTGNQMGGGMGGGMKQGGSAPSGGMGGKPSRG